MIFQNIELHNITELVSTEDGGLLLHRVPKQLGDTLNPKAARGAHRAVGAELRFVIEDDAPVTLRLACEVPTFAYVYDGDFAAEWQRSTILLTPTPTDFEVVKAYGLHNLRLVDKQRKGAFAPHVIRILLPTDAVTLYEVKGNCRPPRADEIPSLACLSYGSSITQGASAIPTCCYVRQMTERLGVDSRNLGFGGGAHMEPQLADWLAEQTFDFATVAMGINVVSHMEREEFEKRVRYFLPKIVSAHPNTYFFCTDFVYFRGDIRHEPNVSEFRAIVKQTVSDLASPYVLYRNGHELLYGIEYLSGDLVHPTVRGHSEMGKNFADWMRPYIEALKKERAEN